MTEGQDTNSSPEPCCLEAEIKDRMDRFKRKPDNLSHVYIEQGRWARHFNTLIWTIGSILVPVTFAGLAVDFHVKDGVNGEIDLWRLGFVALASVSVLLFWGGLAEWHRKLWTRNFVVSQMIEAVWEYRENDINYSKIHRKPSAHLLTKFIHTDWGYYLRWGIIVLGIIFWGARYSVAFMAGF